MRIGGATAVATVAMLASPLAAQQSAGGAAVYQITPAESGFTRLDTRTGSLTHCRMVEGVWQCEPIDGGDGDIAPPIADAGEDDAVAALAARLDALAARVEALAERIEAQAAAATPAPPEPPAALPSRPAKPAPPVFTGQVVARFVEMIRRLKAGAEPG
jgi:hypothetical protein